MVRSVAFLLIATFFLNEGCLRKQSWKAEPPVWPRYRVEGSVLDSLTNLPIYQASVVIYPLQILFADSMKPETTLTDIKGYFVFPSVPAIDGILSVSKEGYISKQKRIVVQRDRVFEIYLLPF